MGKGTMVLALAVLACANSSLATLAYDTPPDWDRGGPGTTFQAWDFLGPVPPGAPLPPEIDGNPVAPAQLTYEPGFMQDWVPVWGGMEGVLPLSGAITIEIPNFPPPNPYKDIYIQLLWTNQTMLGEPLIRELVTASEPVTALLLSEVPFVPTGTPIAQGVAEMWYLSTFVIHLEPNPDFEVIHVGGSVMVDSIFIDTICAPEPMTLVLLGFGGMLTRRKQSIN